MHKVKKYILIYLVWALTLPVLARAQIASVPSQPSRDALEQQLADIEKQITQLEDDLKTTKTQKNQLQAKIKQLKTQAAVLQLKIKSTNLKIKTIEAKIDVTKTAIKTTSQKIDADRTHLAYLLRLLYQQNDANLFLTLLETNGLIKMLDEIQNSETLSKNILSLMQDLQNAKQVLDKKHADLGIQQDDAKQVLSIQTIQQQALTSKLGEEAALLTTTKGQESTYNAMLADKKKAAAEIRNRIYELFEANRTVNFGQAVIIAQGVEKLTGVRAAFLLAILTQESSLGKNVGTCNRAGDPPEKSWRAVMKPDRDQEPFKTITSELGLNINTTPVSCPMKNKDGSQLGWGGAMGPAQFIPSTWMGYRSKIAALTGKAVADPWDIRDAFLAAGIKTGGQGATSISGEWKAAMLYFSGSTNTRYRFYGDNVVATANKYQSDIDALKNN